MNKDCEQCGGSGVNSWENDAGEPGVRLCPCVTAKLSDTEAALKHATSELERLHEKYDYQRMVKRMQKLERVAEAAKNLLEMYDEVHWRDPERDIESALKALEETK